MSSVLLVNANSLQIPLADGSVNCVVTSPPFWGLRSYNTGDLKSYELGAEPLHDCLAWARGDEPCGACFVCNMRLLFRELWRVLRDDGTVWLNLGDSYNGSGGAGGDYAPGGLKDGQPKYSGRNVGSLKPKDLCGVPWRTALALQVDGWYLRSDIIWAKPNPMPESVTDRPTKAHEYLFLLAKSARYFYDAEAIKEPAGGWNGSNFDDPRDMAIRPNTGRKPREWTITQAKRQQRVTATGGAISGGTGEAASHGFTRNKRTVWTISTAPYSGAHFATYPPALVEPCIKAGSPVGGLVFDPFAGSGTTLEVARRLGRRAIGLDLSYAYLHDQARERLGLGALACYGQAQQAGSADLAALPLFAEVQS